MKKLQHPAVRALLWCTTLLITIVIFEFSAQSIETSSETSAVVVDKIVPIVEPFFPKAAAENHTLFVDNVHHYIWKCGHFSEFALLGISILLLLCSYSVKHPCLLAWVLTALYAASDELHQMLADAGRSASLSDVGIDSCGAALGILLVWLLIRRRFLRSNTR